MRTIGIFLLVLMLAACGGNDENTVPVPSSGNLSPEEATFQAQMNEVLTATVAIPLQPTQTSVGEGALVVAQPGTLVASQTEELAPRGVFDYIWMVQEGGQENTTIDITIYSDGRVVKNDVEGNTDAAQVAALDAMINSLNFFGMQGTMLGSSMSADTYRYRVFVQRGFEARLISAQDGYMPQEFIEFLGLIRSVGDAAVPGS